MRHSRPRFLRARHVLMFASLCALAACSGAGSNSAGPVDGDRGGGTVAPDGEALDTGAAQLANLDCAAIKARPAEKPDIVGLFIGMDGTAAYERTACANPAFKVQMLGREPADGQSFASPGYYHTKLPNGTFAYSGISATSGTETIEVSLAGPPDQERVIGVYRALEFAKGSEPATDTLKAQLSEKYGIIWPSQTGDLLVGYYASAADGTELRDDPPNTRPRTQQSILWDKCTPGGRSEASIYENCGLGIEVEIHTAYDNPGLVRAVYLRMHHGAYSFRKVGEYERFAKQANREKQQADVERAKSEAGAAGGRSPDL